MLWLGGEHPTVSVGTSEGRISPCWACAVFLGMRCSWLGFPLQGADLGASGLVAMRSEGNEGKEWPTFGCWCLGGGRGGMGAASLGSTRGQGTPGAFWGGLPSGFPILKVFLSPEGIWPLCRDT